MRTLTDYLNQLPPERRQAVEQKADELREFLAFATARKEQSNYGIRKITISFEVSGDLHGCSDDELKEWLEDRLNEFGDGRYLFEREMISRGLARLLQYAIQSATATPDANLFPGEEITVVSVEPVTHEF